MRPCRQCRTPIENNVATCPQCGGIQDEKAKTPPAPRPVKPPPPALPRSTATASTTPRHRSFMVRFLDAIGHEGCMALSLLILLGAVVGGALGGVQGILAGVAGAVIAIALAFAVIRLLESSEG